MFTLTLQISKLKKAVVLNSFPHERFWQFVYTENVRCTRLMQRSLKVVIQQKFVLWMLKSPAHPPILMPKEFQSLVYILYFFLGGGGSRNDRLNEFVMLICIYNNAMRSCNESKALHCVESYLYYIILVNKKIFLRSETRERKK